MWEVVNYFDETGLKQKGCFVVVVFYHESLVVLRRFFDLGTVLTHKNITDIFVQLYTSSGVLMNSENTNFKEILLNGLATSLNFILSRKCKETISLV